MDLPRLYVAMNLLTEFARRDPDLAFRRTAIALSTRFDRVGATSGTVLGITGLLAIFVLGYSNARSPRATAPPSTMR